MTRIKTNDLYQLALYMCWGAEIERTQGTYPNTVFEITMPKWKKILADLIPFINWKKYKKQRVHLKHCANQSIYAKTFIGDLYPELLKKI